MNDYEILKELKGGSFG